MMSVCLSHLITFEPVELKIDMNAVPIKAITAVYVINVLL
jgi:hypothetical protein